MSTVSDLLTIRIGGDPEERAHPKRNRPKGAAQQRPTSNRIKSTKYTLFTFVPQNLLEQFRRIANFYFLVMVIISIVIGESAASGYTFCGFLACTALVAVDVDEGMHAQQ